MRAIATNVATYIAWCMADREPHKAAEPTKISFVGQTHVGPENHALDGVHIDAIW